MRNYFFILLLVLSNCTKKDDGVLKSADFSKLTPTCFSSVSTTPQISMGTFFAGSNWNDPHVLKIDGQFVMYASADINFTKNIKIYRLVSVDGLSWSLSPSTAVFERSYVPGAWDSESVETPAVVFFNNLYYMFYTAYTNQTDSSTYKIGYATSPDGIQWTRQSTKFSPTNPSGLPDLNFMQYIVAEPAPVVFNNKIYLYFVASGAHMSVNSTLFSIGLTTSSDGTNWDAPQAVLLPDQNLYPRSTWIGYSTPHATVLNNQVHLFFDVAKDNPFKQEKIHHAVSGDGRTNWLLDSAALFDKSQISWADDQINGPAVLLNGDKLYLWFGGQGNISAFPNITMGINTAICPL